MKSLRNQLTTAVSVIVLSACARPAAAPESRPRPRLDVERAEGASEESIGRLFARALQPLGPCLPDGGGRVHVHVTSTDGHLAVALEPHPSLDARARGCTLDALQTVYLEETGSNAGGPGVPPSRFTSTLTLSW